MISSSKTWAEISCERQSALGRWFRTKKQQLETFFTLLHQAPFTPQNFSTKNPLHQKSFRPEPSIYTRTFLHQKPSYCRNLFTPKLYTKKPLHPKFYAPKDSYTRSFLTRRTSSTPKNLYISFTPGTSTRRFFTPGTIYARNLLYTPETFLHQGSFLAPRSIYTRQVLQQKTFQKCFTPKTFYGRNSLTPK